MKNTNIRIAASTLILFCLISLVACQKKYTVVTPAKDSVMDMIDALRDTPQKFSGQAGQLWTIVGQRGTRIHFNPKTFRDNSGATITSGTIDIELIETPKASDMVLNGVTTISGQSQLLKSGGAIKITATQNGNPVIVGEQFGIDFLQDMPSTDTMLVFQGWSGAQQPSFNGDGGIVGWSEVGYNPQNGTMIDTSSLLNYYSFDSVLNFNWINLDKFYNDSRPKTNVTCTLSGAQPKQYGATVFVILPEINGTLSLFQPDENNPSKLDLGNNLKIPVGMKAHFVALAKINSEYYFAKKEGVTIVNNHTGELVLEKKSLAEIKAAIRGL